MYLAPFLHWPLFYNNRTMIRPFLCILSSLTLALTLWGQLPIQDRPYMELTGYAEKWVEPNQIFLSITLKEKEEGRNKRSIQQQEEKLKTGLTERGISIEKLKRANANNETNTVFWGKKEETIMEYELELSDAEQLSQVMNLLDDLDVQQAHIARVDHTERLLLAKDIELQALRDVKTKAKSWAETIGTSLGNPIIIRKVSGGMYDTQELQAISIRGSRNDGEMYYIDGIGVSKQRLTFKNLHFTSTVYVKFEINE